MSRSPTHRDSASKGAKRVVWLILAVPTLFVFVFDLAARPSSMLKFDGQNWVLYGLSFAMSLLLWGLLLYAGSRSTAWVSRLYFGVFVFFFTLAWGGQRYFFQQYHAYLNRHVAQFATNFSESVTNQLLADAPNYLRFKLPALGLAVLVASLARRLLRRPFSSSSANLALGRVHLATLFVLLASLVLPNQATRMQACMPDLLYMEALGEMARTQLGWGKHSYKKRPGLRRSSALAPIASSTAKKPNVVLVVLESVRKDATCVDFDPDCKKTPYTNLAFPHRVALPQLRALDSCTIVSMGVLYAGLTPVASRKELHERPLLFDFAKAAGYQTAFFTSQNLLFGNMGLWLKTLGADLRLAGLDVDPHAHMDLGAHEGLFAERVVQLLTQLSPPYFLTLQLSNGHYPYLVDEKGPQPFQPATTSKAPERNEQFFNHYQNAIHQEDEHLARILKAIRSAPGGEETVIIYTSDHGEAFREHDQMGHTFSLYDEELLVPGFIDVPSSVVTKEQEESLRKNASKYLVHPDLTATVLDLFGIFDAPEVKALRSKMPGRSLLRPIESSPLFPLSNCTELWTCAFENWGVMRGSLKLQAREWDSDYRCFDLARDPHERHDLGNNPRCRSLRDRARALFPRLPGRGRN